MGVSSLPLTVTGQRRDCDLNPGPSAPESSTLSTRLRSHPAGNRWAKYPASSVLLDTVEQCRPDIGASSCGVCT